MSGTAGRYCRGSVTTVTAPNKRVVAFVENEARGQSGRRAAGERLSDFATARTASEGLTASAPTRKKVKNEAIDLYGTTYVNLINGFV